MEAVPKQMTQADLCIQLLLFVDKRPGMREKIKLVRDFISRRQEKYACELQVIDVGEQPYLVEHFKLVATPALIKLHPGSRQILAGDNLIEQLNNWWARWQQAVEDYQNQAGQNAAHNGNSVEPGVEQGIEVGIERGKATQSVASVSDEAELIRLSDELFQVRQQNEDLQAQLSFKDRLIAMLAHDLRNPLTALSIALETLDMGGGVGENSTESKMTSALQKQLMKHARTQTKAIDRMITDVLQAAEGSNVRFKIHPVPLDLQELLVDTLNRLERQFQGKSQTVRTDIPQDLPNIYADPERVRQLLVNLLDNAMKYTPNGGKIEIAALHRTTQKVQVSISDTGPGIPLENQDRIFEDRFRLERDESKDGYGIGLALCQRIVRAHYGQIWVDSLPGKGSSFHFTLPVYQFQ
ncbi:MAG: histidine kinase [Leptolyngbyaceae bacterium]|nr:histidine kinase [Leptolyngbyaceae bacterium]